MGDDDGRERVKLNVLPRDDDADGGRGGEEGVLVALLEKGDQQLGPAIKAVFDRSLQNTFGQTLEKNIRLKNAEIKSICNENYEEFIESIDNLVTVKNDIAGLRKEVKELNDRVQESGREVLSKAQQLMEYVHIERNLCSGMETVERFQQVISLMTKAHEQTVAKKYFPALKTLDHLRRAHLAKFGNIELVEYLENEIAQMLVRIKEDVKAEFDVWLRETKSRSDKLGALAIMQVEKQLNSAATKEAKRRHRRMKKSGSGTEGPSVPEEIMFAENEENINEDELFERVRIEFSPVYQALHIFDSLNIQERFVRYYKEQREAYAAEISDLPSLGHEEFLKSLPAYLARLVAFFMIEDSILKSGNRVLSRSDVEQLWEMAVGRVKVVLIEQISAMQRAEDILELKGQIVLLCKTLDGYGCITTPLTNVLVSHRDRFEEVLLARLDDSMDKILAQEKWEPLTIANVEDYDKFVLSCGLDVSDEAAKDGTFPKGMAFSSTVPLACRAIKRYIVDSFAFAASLPEMHSVIRHSIDHAMIDKVDGRLNRIVDESPSLNISQAVQIAINASSLLDACDFVEKYILSFADPRFSQPIVLDARDAFSDTRARCEDQVFEIIDSKIDAIMSGLAGQIDWSPRRPQDGISDYVLSVVSYLETTLTCVEHMPAAVKLAVHFTSCKHIANLLLSFLKSSPTFNSIGIYNLDVDLRFLEEFTRRRKVRNLEDTFAEMRQFVDLFMSGNVQQILDKKVRESRFPQLAIETVRVLFDKYRDVDSLASLPQEVPRIPRKTVEMVVRQLRSI